MLPTLPWKWELYLGSGDGLAGRTPPRVSERPENTTTHWRGAWLWGSITPGQNTGEVLHDCTKLLARLYVYASLAQLQPWVKYEAEKLKRTSALRPVRLQLAQQQWQKHFFPMTTKHDSSQLEAKRNKKALVAHVSPTFCNLSISVPSHARLTCDMSTGKQRRRTTRRINAQCELSEGIWGSNVSVKWRVRKCCCEVTQTFMLKQN